ncbi:short chain dehydrogenase/reductase family protein [Podospora appendiculata]|uniref:Short chain dehydrogenase/reductase family protein n=1 Tax=Podospora appendiculata TaxID=314037 RepID=A0AAE0X794_9PEZI|nr:short chain dehydrogenase/reductase family protein [Podospora appendiculata]
MPSNKVVLVTGANRGLGYAILQVAGARGDPSTTFILASRDLAAGQQAKASLEQEGVKATIDVLKLDVTNDDEVLAAVQHVATTYGHLDVLVNNAGIISVIPDYTLPTLRRCMNDMLNVNVTSVGIVTTGFTQLLQKSPRPRVVNITSGLGSIANTLAKPITRYPPYGISKVALNGVTAHMQSMENDRAAKAGAVQDVAEGYIRFFSVAPGLLKTAFTNYNENGLDAKEGAEAVAHLIADDEGKYRGGAQLEFVGAEMKTVPW